jgi:hypothetical protein
MSEHTESIENNKPHSAPPQEPIYDTKKAEMRAQRAAERAAQGASDAKKTLWA